MMRRRFKRWLKPLQWGWRVARAKEAARGFASLEPALMLLIQPHVTLKTVSSYSI
jgi:hypothetical protein